MGHGNDLLLLFILLTSCINVSALLWAGLLHGGPLEVLQHLPGPELATVQARGELLLLLSSDEVLLLLQQRSGWRQTSSQLPH